MRIDVPLFRVRANRPDGLLRVVDLVGLRVVAVAAQPVSQDHRRHAVVVEERDEVRALRSHVQRVVPSARRQDHRRSGIDPCGHAMDLDRRVVDVDDALDASGHAVLHVVLLGLADAVRVQVGGAGRKERQDLTALENRRRRERRRRRGVGCAPAAEADSTISTHQSQHSCTPAPSAPHSSPSAPLALQLPHGVT